MCTHSITLIEQGKMEMRSYGYALIAFLSLSGCLPEPPGPPAARISTPTSEGTEARDISFRAENRGTSVIADCTLTAPGVNTRFQTPAVLSFPVNDDERVSINEFSCSYNGIRYEWNGLPGADTRGVLFEFGGGFAEIYFLRRGNTVLYVIRGGEFVTVSGSPDP
jgi:hypothetical protein